MPEEDKQTNATDQQEDTQQDDSQVAQPDSQQDEATEETPKEEAPKQEDSAPVEAPPAQEDEPIDIEEYWKQRYQAPQTDDKPPVDDLTKELSSLPTDDDGTVDAKAAAEWFANKLAEAERKAQASASTSARQAAMEIVSETAQQQQLIQKYPEITKDKELLEDIFDKRDASLLRGEQTNLLKAAERVMRYRQQAEKAAEQKANRTTTIQSAAHLETASVKSEPTSGRQQLVEQAMSGRGDTAKAARLALLKQYVDREAKDNKAFNP